jgi:hypothetical protein
MRAAWLPQSPENDEQKPMELDIELEMEGLKPAQPKIDFTESSREG